MTLITTTPRSTFLMTIAAAVSFSLIALAEVRGRIPVRTIQTRKKS